MICSSGEEAPPTAEHLRRRGTANSADERRADDTVHGKPWVGALEMKKGRGSDESHTLNVLAAQGPRAVKTLPPSPGTPGEGGGEGDFDDQVLATPAHRVRQITLTLTLSRSTGRGGRNLRLKP